MSDSAIIRTQGLSKEFGDVRAVLDLDLIVNQGEMFALVGPDGAGKTTTMRMLCGILFPTSGSARVLGHDVGTDPDEVKRRIGYLSQKFSLYGDLSIDENIEFFAEIHRVADFRSRREELLQFTRLTPFRSRLAEKLSGGMRQKLGLACTLIHTPRLLFLDEPTTGVDPVSRRDFWMILQSLLKEGMTIFMTTPYLDEAERCSRVALMNKGKLMDVGKPESLRRHAAGEVLEIVCDPVRKAYEVLRASGEFESVQAFGDRLNLIVQDAGHAATRVGEMLRAAGVKITGSRVIDPGLENVFISLVTSHIPQEAEQ